LRIIPVASNIPGLFNKVVAKSATRLEVFAVNAPGLVWRIPRNGATLPFPNQKPDWGKEKNL
jgi:hypothetical protein